MFLVLANGFFVAAEFSLVKLRRSQVQELSKEYPVKARYLLHANQNLDTYLAATQLGITMSSLALGWIGERYFVKCLLNVASHFAINLPSLALNSIATSLSFALITFLHIVLGELVPKSLALQNSEKTALHVVQTMRIITLLFSPLTYVLNSFGNSILSMLGLYRKSGSELFYSTSELNLIVKASHSAGVLQEVQQEAAERIFFIHERKIREVMTPRHEVEWIDIKDSPKRILNDLRTCEHTQVLVCEKEIDQILGIMRKQDFLEFVIDKSTFEITKLLHSPIVVHESMNILSVLETFQKKPVRMAIVVDEYGGLEGIVTQTDLLEAIAGDIPEPGEEPNIVEHNDGSLLFDGMTPAIDAFEALEIKDLVVAKDFSTIAGFVILNLGKIPNIADSFHAHGWLFEVKEMEGRRIKKILAKPDLILTQ